MKGKNVTLWDYESVVISPEMRNGTVSDEKILNFYGTTHNL